MDLSENDSLLQNILNSSPTGTALLKCEFGEKATLDDFSIVLANTATRQWAATADCEGMRYGAAFPMLDNPGIHQILIETAASGIPAAFKLFYAGEGLNHWLRVKAAKEAAFLVLHIENITRQQHAESVLEKSLEVAERQRRLYDSITSTTPDLIYVFDLAYKFAYANKALLAMWGKSAADAIGTGLRENGYPEWHALMHEREIDEVVATKKSVRGTVSYPHAVLGTRTYDYILAPVLDEAGQVEAVAGTTRDITDIKQAEKNLQDSEIRFRNIINTTPVGTAILTGPEMKIIVANEVITGYWKRDKSEVIGKPLTEALTELAEQPFPKLLSEVYTTGVSYFDNEALAYVQDESGDLAAAYFSYSYTALREADGTIYGISVIAIDVTQEVLSKKQLEESESRFRALADESPMFVFIIEPDPLAPVSYWNKTYLDYTGQNFQEAQGRAWDGIIHSDDISLVMEQYLAAFADRKPYLIPAVRTRRHDGIFRWHAFKGNPRYSADGSFNGYVGVGFDVHDQKITEEKLELVVEERTRELLRSNNDLQQFAHVASHDLKEPVRKIITFAGRLEEHLQADLDAASIRYLERIKVASSRMYAMIDGVLAYSTVNENVQPMDSVDLNSVMENIAADLEVPLQEANGEIAWDRLPTIEGAAVLLYQLFYNLASNSLKFARKDRPPYIRISAETVSPPGANNGIARITLTDNGIGFPPEYGNRIFETFTRLNPKDEYEGTGLGLSLCKKIAERHSGDITALAKVNEGASFLVTLPLKQSKRHV